MRFQRHRIRHNKPKKSKTRWIVIKVDTSLWNTVIAAVLTALLTFVGIAWQLHSQRQQFEKARLLDGAYITVQETSRLLNDGYNALAKLSRDSDRKTWEEIADGPWLVFMDFHRQWRQQLIALHFQLDRYFGKDLADELIHVDEIDLHPTPHSLGSRGPCTSHNGNNSFDMERLAQQTECYLRVAAVMQSSTESDRLETRMSDFIENMQAYDAIRKNIQKLIAKYDKSSIRFLRAMETRLIQFQGGPYVVVRSSSE